MYNLISELCKAKGTTITKLCEEVTGSSGNLATWKKGYMRSDYLLKVAQRLDVSVDYLLGLIREPVSYRRTVTEIILPKNFQEDDIAKVQEYIEFLQYKKEQAKDRK